LKDGEIDSYMIQPEDFGLSRDNLTDLKVDDAAESLVLVKKVLSGEHGEARDIVLMNAGAAIYAADLVDTLEAGVKRAAEVIDSGEAAAKLDALVTLSNSF
jgi:anthranilate phosphoribosyltransferase